MAASELAALQIGTHILVVINALGGSPVADLRRRGVRIANVRNLGFAAAVKQGMRVSTSAAAGGLSIPKIRLEFRQFYWYGGLLRYSAKHFPALELKVICLAVLVGSNLRPVIGFCCSRSLNPIAVICKVARLASCLVSLRQRSVQALF